MAPGGFAGVANLHGAFGDPRTDTAATRLPPECTFGYAVVREPVTSAESMSVSPRQDYFERLALSRVSMPVAIFLTASLASS